jgi:hypothetical protein
MTTVNKKRKHLSPQVDKFGGDFITEVLGTPQNLELPQEVLELLELKPGNPRKTKPTTDKTDKVKSRPTKAKEQTYLFYRHEGHLCITTPQKLGSLDQTPIFKTSKGSWQRSSFCQVLMITEQELEQILASAPGNRLQEPPHTLETLHELLATCQECFETGWRGVTRWMNSESVALGSDTPLNYLKKGEWERIRSLLGAIQ